MEAGCLQTLCRCCEAVCWAQSPGRVAHCQKQLCIHKAEHFCDRLLKCGHPCSGVRGESSCTLPCCYCGNARGRSCGVCLQALVEAASIVLSCGHYIHMACAMSMIEIADWRGRQIRFAAVRCPGGCGTLLDHPSLASSMAPIHGALAFVERNVVLRATVDGILQGNEAIRPDLQVLLTRYVYFQCFKCRIPYCGGRIECEIALQMKEPSPETVECASCRMGSQGGACAKHGTDFMAIKCDFCCNEALFRCGGGIMYCASCHCTNLQQVVRQCNPVVCPLRGHHPRGRTHSWMMGCAACHGDATNGLG
eukprot:TRINITY_DN50086_c0_g1_i1.p1 TRINITY_DN50086_c0_g1~~TRINITY_DN50086_c0_g1_i1.p1  ORF type:complete len:308 (-),score=36.18 TRINITY_DN50086_c0_g1_i1:36-959(-)